MADSRGRTFTCIRCEDLFTYFWRGSPEEVEQRQKSRQIDKTLKREDRARKRQVCIRHFEALLQLIVSFCMFAFSSTTFSAKIFIVSNSFLFYHCNQLRRCSGKNGFLQCKTFRLCWMKFNFVFNLLEYFCLNFLSTNFIINLSLSSWQIKYWCDIFIFFICLADQNGMWIFNTSSF